MTTERSDRRLVARTTPLDMEIDPFHIAGESGVLFAHTRSWLAGRGIATRLTLPPGRSPSETAAFVAGALGSIEELDEVRVPGTGAVAFAALPFSCSDPHDRRSVGSSELVVPELLVGRDEDGRQWLTTVTGAADDEHRAALLREALAPPAVDGAAGESLDAGRSGGFEVVPALTADEWCSRVERAIERMADGQLRKVVLAREVDVRTDCTISRADVLLRLRDTYPGCMLFAVDGFVGASPELLVARRRDRVRSHPLAGTAPRSADPDTDTRLALDLRSSAKNREEHRITIDMVHDTLLPFCSYLDEEAEPSIVPMANVQHLGTMVEGRLSSPPPSALELALTLHPTPAVGGSPTGLALATITELESLDRGRYAGPVGWVDCAGNGEWAVGIRSAEIDSGGHRARVFAGVGIVPDSDPLAELAETRAKFQAMLSALVRP